MKKVMDLHVFHVYACHSCSVSKFHSHQPSLTSATSMSLFVPHLKDTDPALAASFLSPSLSLSRQAMLKGHFLSSGRRLRPPRKTNKNCSRNRRPRCLRPGWREGRNISSSGKKMVSILKRKRFVYRTSSGEVFEEEMSQILWFQ